MNRKDFDRVILHNLLKKYPNAFGYYSQLLNKKYDTYYSNLVFSTFIDNMKSKNINHYHQYNSGNGSELKERKGIPPKMACVGSSSRFCYIALNDVNWENSILKGVPEFEYSCPIDGIRGTSPQLDAFFKESNTYFEVKCHEIFEKHPVILSSAYWNLIYGEGNDFRFNVTGTLNHGKENSKQFQISLEEFGFHKEKEKSMFDIKQLLCHLLGIKYSKKKDEKSQNAELVYLFFIPQCSDTNDSNKINREFKNLKREIITIFSSNPINQFCKTNNITLTAMAEKSEIMEPLSDKNTEIIYSSQKASHVLCK